MAALLDTRRYLTDFDSWRTGHIVTDVLVIGGGVAGSRAAIEAARYADFVLLLCKRGLTESVTHYAQGGVANVRASDDSPQRHIDDTLRVGCGLGNAAAVERVVRESTQRIDELMQWGMRFDTDGKNLALTREGGHTADRILHHQGDATGRELSRVLTGHVQQINNIRIFDQCFLIDLITVDGRCVGAVTFHETHGHQLIWAKQTILASGGCGRLYRETSNPAIATGDGYAAAYRAGARLADVEMMQFHPTTLYVAGANRVLISEAVRGEGGLLVDRDGKRFMQSYHTDAELAPRDVVSRAIIDRMRITRMNCVYLDVRHIGRDRFTSRFPTIARMCKDFQIDVGNDLIPVRPAAHYMIGGVLTDLDGRTSIDRLLCCGEVACMGLHGANRLASNSLLEGLVFGAAAGEAAGRSLHEEARPMHRGHVKSDNPVSQRTELDLADIRNSLRSLMWRNMGVERNGDRLAEAREIIDFWGHYLLDKTFNDPAGWEMQNMLSLARLMVTAAHARTHSLGVHHRTDHDGRDDEYATRHIVIQRNDGGPRITHAGLDLTPQD